MGERYLLKIINCEIVEGIMFGVLLSYRVKVFERYIIFFFSCSFFGVRRIYFNFFYDFVNYILGFYFRNGV